VIRCAPRPSGDEPTRAFGTDGQPVQDTLNQPVRKHVTPVPIYHRAGPFLPTLSDQDWVIYQDCWIMFGEEDALQWVVSKCGQH
jgi:hypothetical protein